MISLTDFFDSSVGRETMWYVDEHTDELVGFCPSCRAEVRLSKEQPAGLSLFTHDEACPHSDEKRAQRLAEKMITLLEEETDNRVAAAAVTFLLALQCEIAAKEIGVSPVVMAKQFVRAFEQRVGDVDQVMPSERKSAA